MQGTAHAKELAMSPDFFQTGFRNYTHLPQPDVCLETMRKGQRKGNSLEVEVPLFSIKNVYIGGQFIIFDQEKSYLPLSTPPELGGLPHFSGTNAIQQPSIAKEEGCCAPFPAEVAKKTIQSTK